MKIARTLLIGLALCAVLLIGGCAFLPSILSAVNPQVIYRIPNASKTLYLTIDDGPSPATELILEVLKKHGAKATFFIVTDHLRPEVMRRLLADGHQVGHHMKTTVSLSRLSEDQFQSNFLAAEAALAPFSPAKLFRPPGGAIDRQQCEFVADRGYEIVIGTVYPLDHWLENKALIKTLTKLLTTDGGIIILHDTAARGFRTAEVLDGLIPELKTKGYHFAMLPDRYSNG